MSLDNRVGFAKKLPDHSDRYEHQADKPRNMRHPDGVVQQKVQLTPPGEPTHVPQRKHDTESYRTLRAVGADVPAWNPDAPPVTLRDDEAEQASPLGGSVADHKQDRPAGQPAQSGDSAKK
jgi:hypothetical protein